MCGDEERCLCAREGAWTCEGRERGDQLWLVAGLARTSSCSYRTEWPRMTDCTLTAALVMSSCAARRERG